MTKRNDPFELWDADVTVGRHTAEMLEEQGIQTTQLPPLHFAPRWALVLVQHLAVISNQPLFLLRRANEDVAFKAALEAAALAGLDEFRDFLRTHAEDDPRVH